MSIRHGLLLSDGELDDLVAHLGKVADIAMSLAIAATGHLSRTDGSGSHVAPTSRPPYDIGAQQLLDELCNELGTTVRHVCEHRCIDVPESCGTVFGQAQWLRRNVVAVGVMPDAREIHTSLCKVIARAARASGETERKVHWTSTEREYANRMWLTATEIEQWARRMGTDYRRLTRRRVEYLAQRLPSSSRYRDPDSPRTAPWRYRVGDVIAAYDDMERHAATS